MLDLTLVFDLDGTLVDTAPDLIRAANHVFALEGLPALAGGELKPAISFGARQMLATGLRIHGISRGEAEIDVLLDRFLAFYGDNIAVESRPFPGVVEVLEQCRADGAELAVCTNKREQLSRRLLGGLGLAPVFRAIAGRDTFPVCKPHRDHLLGTIRLAGGDPRRAVMVGDSDTDIQTAKAARIPIIGVTFGYTDVPVAKLGADDAIDHYAELRPALARLLHKIESC
jgi:phosphoglycolate phosphatase